ncbi:curli assembly protein CsgF [Alcanivorax nanhaiticus]|uniref:Curli production assembly/transport component CsgF n=1 Tax=Alcanivorax nanhaiticus TaxID=1177154 RepID=A0A095UTU8_9GAMM|nr:curli assembly protein CsgF [Alcanivorax nanhaiticus]KGD65975.1 curli assembly protein CsgF [Alcanivorax nanhaiticus]
MKMILKVAAGLLLATGVAASELVYQPVNPNFGGNPLNGSHLLGNAQAQNDYKDPEASSSGYERPSDLERLTSSLQSRLLSQLLADVGAGNEGSIVTEDFAINIVDDQGVLSILIEDINTGEVTQIEVDGLVPDTF